MLKTRKKTTKTKALMAWNAESFRWSNTYQVKRYKVTCDELDAPRDKTMSLAAANDWWKRTAKSYTSPPPSLRSITSQSR